MRTFGQHVIEEKTSRGAVKAEDLRRKAVETYRKALTKTYVSPKAVSLLKKRLRELSSVDFTSPDYRHSNFTMLQNRMRDEMNSITVILDREYRDHKERRITENPFTVCELLADPDPKRFLSFMKSGLPLLKGERPKWMSDLDRVEDLLSDWFGTAGGPKGRTVSLMRRLISCKNRAPWASWEGKAYRGVRRSAARIRKYEFTEEVRMIGGQEWLVANGTYVSRYGAQSWTDDLNVAMQFSYSNQDGSTTVIPVILEVSLKRSDTLFSPSICDRISKQKGAEREVIRVGNDPIPLTIYVSAEEIYDQAYLMLVGSRKSMSKVVSGVGKDAVRFAHGVVASLIGVGGADAFAKTKAFGKLVKDVR